MSLLATNLRSPQKRSKRVELGIKAVPRVSVCEAVTEQIMTMIANGELKPGQRLPAERELCASFDVGRSSLREALRCLSVMGVLSARVGDGTRVAQDGSKFFSKVCEWRLISERDDIENLMETRMALEGATAANVASAGTAEQIAELRALVNQMKAALGAEEKKRFSALDIEFHLKIAEFSGNKLLMDLVLMLRNQLAQGLRRVLLVPQALPLSQKEHMAIMTAIEKRDATLARDQMQAHLHAALVRYRSDGANTTK
jgi:GntR family transcriptional repressor for pyruvate dehydrogenase complex